MNTRKAVAAIGASIVLVAVGFTGGALVATAAVNASDAHVRALDAHTSQVAYQESMREYKASQTAYQSAMQQYWFKYLQVDTADVTNVQLPSK